MDTDEPGLLDLVLGAVELLITAGLWAFLSFVGFLILRFHGVEKVLAWNISIVSVGILLCAALLLILTTKPQHSQ